MTTLNPWRTMQEAAGAVFAPFGASGTDTSAETVDMVQTFGAYELEYAAIRKGVGVLHLPQRGLLRLTGKDRQDFLHRLLTQDIRNMRGGDTRRAMQLDNKGRIVADLMVHHGEADTWLELDIFDVAKLRAALEQRLFSEDVQIENFTPQRMALALHGPASLSLLRTLAGDAAEALFSRSGTHQVLTIAGSPMTAYRLDDCGVPGLHLLIPTESALAVYQQIAEVLGGLDPAVEGGVKREITGRGIGWLAYNTARIEAGWPMFHIDFGPDSLPHETGLVTQAVSFTKGCYLGQEIVARMQNRGHPARVLAGLRFTDDRLPLAGAQVTDAAGAIVGAVTSSTLSPLLGNVALALAMMKWDLREPGTKVMVPAEGANVLATVQALGPSSGTL
jgi:tRNA-modifying protein YgfZ